MHVLTSVGHSKMVWFGGPGWEYQETPKAFVILGY